MARYTRNTVILAKIETTPGVDASPTGASNAVLISNMTINPLNAQNVPRDVIRGYFGGSEQLVGNAYLEVTFDVEVAGAGAAGDVPAWGPLLRACAFDETIDVGVSVGYTPVSTGIKSLTIYYYDDGALHKLLMSRGDVSIKLGSGERPLFSFRFMGLDGGLTAAANATPDTSGFVTPLAVTDPNTGNLLFGCTYATAALSGGTSYASRGLQLALGNQLAHIPLLGGESIELVGPEDPEPRQPVIDVAQGRHVELVVAAGALGPDLGEAGLAQHLEMLADCRLGDAEFARDHVDHLARGQIADGQQFEDAAADGIAEDVEGVHQSTGPLPVSPV